MPSFAGIDLGDFCTVRTAPNKADLQITSYPGVNGLAALPMGSRGYVTEVQMGAIADSMWDLGAIAATWYAAVASQASGDLVDSYGYTWPNVIITNFFPADDIVFPPDGAYGQMFTMEFLHLD